jgi:uncharacterized membrane protein YdjX (TVP38/TMEM64 family)
MCQKRTLEHAFAACRSATRCLNDRNNVCGYSTLPSTRVPGWNQALTYRVASRMPLTRRKAKRAAKRYWPLGAAAVGLLALVVAWMLLPAAEWIDNLGQKVAELGWAGPVIYFVLYVIGTTILAPSPIMSIAAGVAFGWWGLPLLIASATAGATASFCLSRYFFSNDLQDWLTERRIFNAAKTAIDEEGWRVQLLFRLSPMVPFGLLNYLLGLTNTSLVTYVTCTVIGILPGSIVDIYIGVAGKNVGNTVQFAYLLAGLIATAALVVLITVKARGYLREAGIKV